MPQTNKKMPFKVGDLVTTTYYHENIVRKITKITKDSTFGTGFSASVDGGEACKCCHRVQGSPIEDVDSGWFELYTPTAESESNHE